MGATATGPAAEGAASAVPQQRVPMSRLVYDGGGQFVLGPAKREFSAETRSQWARCICGEAGWGEAQEEAGRSTGRKGRHARVLEQLGGGGIREPGERGDALHAAELENPRGGIDAIPHFGVQGRVKARL